MKYSCVCHTRRPMKRTRSTEVNVVSIQLSVLRVFLASPGDLQAEREIVRDVIRGVNQSIGRRVGRQIELYGWEDTRPGYGRPQALINPEVEACDLFLGLLWRRWGTATGSASSGFEEEFNIALKRREHGESPEIWLYFKHIPSSALRDPGEQLQQVMDFRKGVQDSRKLLYKDFKNAASLKSLLYEALSAYLLDLTSANPGVSELAVSSGPPSKEEPADLTDVPASLVETLSAVGTMLTSRNALERSKVARLQLWASALTSTYREGEHLGTHTCNFIYEHREAIELTILEARYLFETFIGDLTETKPGWYWFQDLDLNSLPNPSPERFNVVHGFVKGFLELLKILGRIPSREICEKIAASPDESIRTLLVDRLITFATTENANALENRLTVAEYQWIMMGIAARKTPYEALVTLLTRREVDSGTLKLIPNEIIRDVPLDILVKALDHPDSDVRLLVLTEVDRRGMPSREHLEKLKMDANKDVRVVALKSLLRLGALTPRDIDKSAGTALDTQDELRLEYFRSRPTQQLEDLFDLFDVDTYPALQVLIERCHPEFIDVVRKDLLDTERPFYHLQSRAHQKLRNSELETASGTIEAFERRAWILQLFCARAALQGLCSLGQGQDREIALRWVTKENLLVRIPAIDLLLKTALPEDADILTDLAVTSFGRQLQCAEAAFDQSPSQDEPGLHLLRHGDNLVKRIALCLLSQRRILIPDEEVQPLLRSEDTELRLSALAYLAAVHDEDFLSSLLASYLSGYHYYNVVVWLDRLLYAPDELASAYKATLVSRKPDVPRIPL
jgi:hypothetical protein